MDIAKRLVSSLKNFAKDLSQGNLDKYRVTTFKKDENGNLVRKVREPKKE